MRINRKPAPLRYEPEEESSRSLVESTDNEPLLGSVGADIKRYSLTDPPVTTASKFLTFNDIDDAVRSLQSRRSGGAMVQSTEAETSYSVTPIDIKPSLPPRPPVAIIKTSTIMEPYSKNFDNPPMLPTINSGEPLTWDSVHIKGSLDPSRFQDNSVYHPSDLEDHGGQSPSYSQDVVSNSIAYDERRSYHDLSLTHSSDTYSLPVREPSSQQEALSTYYSYSQQSLPLTQYSDSYNDAYQNYYRGQLDQTNIDRFNRDTEAYASEAYPQTPRSRSATPEPYEGDYFGVKSPIDDSKDGKYGYERISEAAEEESHHQYLYAPAHDIDEKSPISEYPGTPLTTRHFGPAPVGRVQRRHKTKKRVQLTNGNLVVDIPVPTKLVLPLRKEPEMSKTRYTAVTCDPDHFERNNFFLRQNEMNRRTELFIVITMYNEDEVLFCRTLHGVMKNISHLCTRKHSQTWGQDSWKKVVVCIVADGRKKIHPRVLDCLAALGVYQEGDFMKNLVNNKAVTAHLFEYTTSFALDENLHFKYPDKGIVPTQILFCLKEKNQKKINSHRWFFNAFAPLLQPNVCILLDVGTRPSNKSLYRLWKTFDLNSNVGGACGEIAAYKGKNWKELLNPLVASQNFEYKISNILDKTTESLFGYISVLPGAFSAYRYIALQNDKRGVGPLASYFKGEVLHGRDADILTSNLYLAEDRILCFELIAKANASWVLRYVKGATGETDVPDGLPEFISQRRRWLNGSFFAAVYAIAHTGQILRSGHSAGRKFILMIETIYNIVNLVFAWFAMGNFYLFFIILTSSLENPAFNLPGIQYFNSIIQYAYAYLIAACFLFSMGNKPKASPWKYKLSAICFAVINAYTIICAVVCAIQAARQGGDVYNTMILSVLATYGVYVFSSLLAFDPWHMLTSFVPYVLLTPTYINILNIYAFTNLDDISWGTKQDNIVETDLGAVMQDSNSRVDVEMLSEPSDVNQMYDEALNNLKLRKPSGKGPVGQTEAEKEQKAKDYYANVRTNVVLLWVLTNGLLLLAILSGDGIQDTFSPDSTGPNRAKIYLTFILAFVAITSFIRFGGSTMYLIMHMVTG